MDSERWKRLQDLFDRALELEGEARETFLDESCDDPDLRAEVAALVRAHEKDTGVLQGVVGEAAAEASEGGLAPGERVGPYRIERELGRGGMGAVYLAVRDDEEYRQSVAIKLVRSGLDTEALLRFRSERQILANLDHPNIARLLDGGTADSGLPYVVMEYVDGDPIDVYCRNRDLSVPERLELFRTVCDAVHYAHRNLVVHRDIKPGNILVTGSGQVKLLDFGIAKLLEPDSAPHTVAVTGSAVRLLTPEYASPEQIRGEGITTATDVYSLGVLLYELLTGREPYRLSSRAVREIERVICEVEPVRPSTAVTPESADDTAERCPATGAPGEPRRLRRILSGDLDNIILMAMRKEPERRYPSAEQLGEDLHRHLRGLPVRARKDSWRYRAGKFVRRNRWGVAAAAAFALLLSVFAVTMALQRDRAREAERKASMEAETASQVSDFLTSLFSESAPSGIEASTITLRDVLDQGAERVDDELADRPEIQARMMDLMGQVYGSLGLPEEATPLIEGSLEIRRDIHGPEHRDIATSLHSLGALRYSAGDLDAAMEAYRSSLDMRRRLLADDRVEIAHSLHGVASVHHYRGELIEAEPYYREQVDVLRRAHGGEHAEVAHALGTLAAILMAQGKDDEAEPLYREALDMNRRLLGDDHLAVAEAMSDLAVLYKNRGDHEQAEPFYREVIRIRRAVLGDAHGSTAQSLNNLAVFLARQDRPEEAEAHYREALSIYRKALGEPHPTVALSLNNLGFFLLRQDRVDEATQLLASAVAMYEATMPDDYWLTAVVRARYGRALAEQGRDDEAEALLLRGVEVLDAWMGGRSAHAGEARRTLVRFYEARGREDDAARYREEDS